MKGCINKADSSYVGYFQVLLLFRWAMWPMTSCFQNSYYWTIVILLILEFFLRFVCLNEKIKLKTYITCTAFNVNRKLLLIILCDYCKSDYIPFKQNLKKTFFKRLSRALQRGVHLKLLLVKFQPKTLTNISSKKYRQQHQVRH